MDVLRRSFLTLAAAALLALPAAAQTSITVASTTSTEQSGLFGHLLPAFKVATGIEVKVVALGTGQALDVARRGDADVVFVHDQAAEEKFVADGYGVKRTPVMYNDFVIVGPADDPAKAAGKDTLEALRKIAAAKAPFVSRGDKSGTHAAELRYWQQTGLDLAAPTGIARSGRAWARPSTPVPPPMPMSLPTARRGWPSAIAGSSGSWSKAMSGCSTSMA
jgi:tungstate transport system substrate-binding protein